jgi:hypothetical protein
MDSVNFMEEASQNHTIEDTGAKYLAMDKCRAKIKDKNSYLYIVLCGVINKQGRRARAGGEAGIPDFNLQPSRAFFFAETSPRLGSSFIPAARACDPATQGSRSWCTITGRVIERKSSTEVRPVLHVAIIGRSIFSLNSTVFASGFVRRGIKLCPLALDMRRWKPRSSAVPNERRSEGGTGVG